LLPQGPEKDTDNRPGRPEISELPYGGGQRVRAPGLRGWPRGDREGGGTPNEGGRGSGRRTLVVSSEKSATFKFIDRNQD